jgi:hypothetical protein
LLTAHLSVPHNLGQTFCGQCGSDNGIDNRFCVHCGKALPHRQSTDGLDRAEAEDIAKSLYEEFVQDRSGKGFAEESNSLSPEARGLFAAKIDVYREAMLLMSFDLQAQSAKKWEIVRESCEAHILKASPPELRAHKLEAIRFAMVDLARLLSPDAKRQELTWGIEWFRGIGSDAVVRNPVQLFLFVSVWMDEYVALGETIQKVAQWIVEKNKKPSLGVKNILLFLPSDNEGHGLAELLRKWGYSAKPVFTVQTLLGDLHASRFDLLILDLCDSHVELHVDDMLKLHTKILFLACDRHLHGMLLPSSFTSFLEKPLDVEAFRLKVRELLGETGSKAAIP